MLWRPAPGTPVGLTSPIAARSAIWTTGGGRRRKPSGAAFRSRGIVFDRVLTSQWCRCRDTARLLALGPITEAPFLNSFFADRSTSASLTRDTLRAIGTANDRVMLVTHQVNITALTGVYPSSGEVIVIRVEDGSVTVLGRIALAP